MSFIDGENYRMKRAKKKKHKGIVISSIAGTIVGASLFAFGAPLFSNDTDAFPQAEASGSNMAEAQGIKQISFVDAVDRASEAVVGVVAGANRIEVSLSDGKKVPGKVLGTDVVTDLAVLEIDAKYVKKVIEIGDSNTVRRGEPVIAIGNPLGLQFSGTVTQGIISANERIVPVDLDQDGHYDWQVEVLQTDAAINPGNSGGALVNAAGQLIGINSMKIAAKEVEGIGLAIPVTRAVPIMNELEKYGKVRRPYVGIELRSLNEIPNYYWSKTLHLPGNVTEGVCILDVKSPSPGTDAGLREHDVIVAVDGKPVRDIIGFRTALYDKKINDKMTLTFYRGTKRATTTVKLGIQKY